jgi:D-threo-aldose 1-dehydrogenase
LAAIAIGRRQLGRTALIVSELGFGSAPLGDLYDILDDERAIATASAAIGAGCTLIDTSPLYGHGLAEHRVGTAIRRAGAENLTLSTKIGRVLRPATGNWDREGYKGGLPFSAAIDYSYDGTMRSLEQSLLRLGVARVNICLVHDLDRRNHGADLDARYSEVMSGAWRALLRLRDEKVVDAIGFGVNETGVLVRAAAECDIDAVLLAGRYTLLEQDALDDFLPLAIDRGIGLMLGGVFNSGILATGAADAARYDYAAATVAVIDRVARLEAVCRRHGVSLAAAALQFAAAHPAVNSIVIGAVSPGELSANIRDRCSVVPDSLWAELKSQHLLRADAPTPTGP